MESLKAIRDDLKQIKQDVRELRQWAGRQDLAEEREHLSGMFKLSAEALAPFWDTPEEDEAWQHFQQEKLS